MEMNKCMGCMSDFRGYPCPACGYDPAKEQKGAFILHPGTILSGKFLVGKVLGQGGFGITYLGLDMALERKVAIKEYYPSGQVSRVPGTLSLVWSESQQAVSARREGMELFLKEARKMARLEDIPGVVKVREVFLENETAYIVMDFVEGQTLKDILKSSGPLPWEKAKDIFRPAIQAMEKVHQAGLVHRDLSPDNLMITPEGSVKILDLGAAKDLSVNSGASSMQVAKRGFSPFEQYTQKGGSGPWTDVYAMAATIYYTLTGVLPPVATDRIEEDAIRWDLPGLKALPAPALEALKKGMAVLAKQRTQSMAELTQGLFAEVKQPDPKPQLKPEPPKPQPPKPEPPKPQPPKPEPPKPQPPKPEPKPKKPLPKWLIPALAAVVVLVIGIGVGTKMIKSVNEYKAAQALLDAGKYVKAAEAFEALRDYKDSAQKAKDARQQIANQEAYEEAQALLDAGEYGKAMIKFAGLNYKDSAKLSQEAKQSYWVTQQLPLAAGDYHTLGLRSDGTVVATDNNGSGQYDVSGWRDIVAAAAGYEHTVGLRSDGTLVATGDNDVGQYNVSSWKDIVAVAVGGSHTVGLRSDGTVVATGRNDEGQCNVSGWKDIVAVAAGGAHTVGLRSDGTLVATGNKGNGRCDVNVSGWGGIVAVAAGKDYTVGLRSDGTVIAAGYDSYGQCDVSGWTDIVAVAAGAGHTVGLRSDGTLVATGTNVWGQCNVSNWRDIVAVAAGGDHTVGLRSDGTVVATGYNSAGQCDVSGWTDIRTP